jgi:hypothetical protein
MAGRLRLAVVLGGLLAIWLATPVRGDVPAPAAAGPCEFDNVDRIVAIGDVHGAFERLQEILRIAGLTDERNRWKGGRAHLVQTGDVLDRGPDSLKALEFVRKLEREANSAGGKVHALIGNHETMRLIGDYRYVVPGEYEAFVTPGSAEARRIVIDTMPKENRAAIEKNTPLGMVEMLRAFTPEADLGSYLRTLNAVVRINGVLFMHGGLSPAVAPMKCTEINDTIRRDLTRDFDKTKTNPLGTLVGREDGPLWYRGLAQEPESSFAPEVDKILAAQGARAIVVAHTVDPSGIRVRFGGKVFTIDTGMQAEYVPNGRASALEIRGSVFTAIYKDGRQVLAGGGPQQ